MAMVTGEGNQRIVKLPRALQQVERRANAVSSALQANGGSASQLEVISYGKEKPVCREHNEDCWSKNRRAEIVYTAQ